MMQRVNLKQVSGLLRGAAMCAALCGSSLAVAQEVVEPAGELRLELPADSVSRAQESDAAWPAGDRLASLLRVDPWTTEQKVLAGVSTALILIDWGQTRYIAKSPHRFHETNPLIGRHPSLGDVNRHFALSMAANLAVASLLPSKFRTPWLLGVSGMQAHFVIHNKKMGIRMAF